MTMMRKARLVIGIFAALATAQSWAAGLPAPTGLSVTPDPEDDEGTALILKWTAPESPPPAGFTLAGYAVEHRQDAPTPAVRLYEKLLGQKVPDPAKTEVAKFVKGTDKTETNVKNLDPWPSPMHYFSVSAVYLPEGAAWEVDEKANKLTTKGEQEAATPEVGPVQPVGKWYNPDRTNVAATAAIYTIVVILALIFARRRDMYIRPIAGLQAVDDAIGRATEMGKPLLFVSGLTGIGDVPTIAAMLILGHLARRAAPYETPILAPCNDPMVMSVTREIVRESYTEAGRPDAYQPENIYFVTDSQFGYVAAVDGLMLREKPAANFYMGYFFAESLILAETGNEAGAIQIAGTDADTQLPFFITSCDYTLMGEELYAAGAYLSRDPVLLAQLKGQDIGKAIIGLMLIVSTAIASIAIFHSGVVPRFVEWFNTK
jgi:hypothetical protein